MANSMTTNPWVVDTAGASILFTPDVEVRHFEYTGYAAQGSNVTVQDRFGKNIWVGLGAADQEEVRSGPIGWVHGISVPTLQNGGILRIYFV